MFAPFTIDLSPTVTPLGLLKLARMTLYYEKLVTLPGMGKILEMTTTLEVGDLS